MAKIKRRWRVGQYGHGWNKGEKETCREGCRENEGGIFRKK